MAPVRNAMPSRLYSYKPVPPEAATVIWLLLALLQARPVLVTVAASVQGVVQLVPTAAVVVKKQPSAVSTRMAYTFPSSPENTLLLMPAGFGVPLR